MCESFSESTQNIHTVSSTQKSNIKHPESDSGLPDRSLSHSDSGSGSGCEVCPQLIGRELACCAGHDVDLDSCLSEENYGTRTTCSTLKWSSNSSNSGLSALTIDPGYIAAQSLACSVGHRGEDVQSLHSVTGSGENRSSPTTIIPVNGTNLSTDDVHLILSLAKCNRCNGNLCPETSSVREVRCSTLDRTDVKNKVSALRDNGSINSDVIVNPISELTLKSSPGLISLIQGKYLLKII